MIQACKQVVLPLWLLAHDLLHEVTYPGGMGCEKCLEGEVQPDVHDMVRKVEIESGEWLNHRRAELDKNKQAQ